ncbi:MAG: hypothetical protein H0U12_03870, partial [Thermoleophilaceae bacterium]|nr:hypothetical protein [Thermoleophilaceae bacterium]
RRTGRGRGRRGGGAERPAEASAPTAEETEAAEPQVPEAEETAEPEPDPEAELRAGVLDTLPNGSGFLRGAALAPDRDDVHVSPAQIRRCELRSGDEIAGPVRPPRRSERHFSLMRVETVNGAPAEPPTERPDFDSLSPAYATERLAAPEELAAVPFGKGSRVAVIDPPGAEGGLLLRRLVPALAERHPELRLAVALAGVRPEDAVEWRRGEIPVVGGGADGSIDDQSQAAELALARAKRVAEGGGDALLVVDSLEAIAPDAARRVFAAARRLDGAGTLTVIATLAVSDELARLATTRIVLEAAAGTRGDEMPTVSAVSDAVRADLLGG